MAAAEIRALARIVDELSYYQILDVDPKANSRDIKLAYFAVSRSFHPDANRKLEPGLHAQCSDIAKRVTEAYCVLRDPRRRKAYDQRLGDGNGVRIQLAEARAAHNRQDTAERQGKTPQGRQFFQKAIADLQRNNEASAVRNLQMALTFEPDSQLFKDKLQELRPEKKQR